MKRNSKLLAFAVALAMVMSLITIPVSALGTGYVAPTGVNLFPEWDYGPWNYESTSNTATAKNIYGFEGVKGGNQETKISDRCENGQSYEKKEGIGVNGTAGGLSTLSSAKESGPGLIYVPIEAGFVYKFSVEMKIHSETVQTATVKSFKTTRSTADSVVIPTADTGTLINGKIYNDKFTTVSGYFATVENNIEDNYKKRMHTHLSFVFNKGHDISNAQVITDNWSLEKVPTPAVTLTEVNGTVATFTFNNDLGAVTESNFNVATSTPGAAVPTVAVTKNGNVCNVSLSGCSYNSTYTITTTDIIDFYGQELVDNETAYVVLGDEPDVLGKNNLDGTYETATPGESYGTNAGSKYVTLTVMDDDTDNDSNVNAYEGKRYMKIEKSDGGDTSDNGTSAKTTQAFVLKEGLNVGDTYVVSYYAKASESGQTIRTVPTSMNNSDITPGNTSGAYKALTTEWKKITDYFTVDSSDGAAHNGLRIGIAVRHNDIDVYIDNFTVYKMNSLCNDDYLARLSKTSGSVSLDITNKSATAPDIYFLAAKYDGSGKLVDVKVGETDGISTLNNQTASYIISGSNLDDYTLFIWNKSFAPLNTKIAVSDI